MKSFTRILIATLAMCCFSQQVKAETFADRVGNVQVAPVESTSPIQMPFIIWGGDMATFHANGGLKTQQGTIFHKQGLNLNLVPGDDFVQQVRDYLSGKSPFLRGTFRMISQASEVIGQDLNTKGVMVLQMTWSGGDHAVARNTTKRAEDLKGKKVAIQYGGPHVGMLDDILKMEGLSWDDIEVVWCKNLTGDDSPPNLFKADKSLDVAFMITPDMIGITGGLQNVGNGAEGTIKGSSVLVSTAELSRSIADVIVCRKDFYGANKELVEKLAAGYLKSCEEVSDLRKAYEQKGSQKFMALLQMTQDIYGEDVIPTLEEDAYGLLADCRMVGHPGNVKFFTDKNNTNGFKSMERASLTLMQELGLTQVKNGFFTADFDWQSPTFIGYLAHTQVQEKQTFSAEAVQREIEALNSESLDANTIASFEIFFEPNQQDFSSEVYGAEYHKVIERLQKFGNAVVVVRGHSDPSMTLYNMVKAGGQKGILKSSGSGASRSYALNGRPLDIADTQTLIGLINKGTFDGVPDHNPRATVQAAQNLARSRAEIVVRSIAEFAQSKNMGHLLDPTQIQPQGVGIGEPFIATPRNNDEAGKNRRVEFRLIRVSAEAENAAVFQY